MNKLLLILLFSLSTWPAMAKEQLLLSAEDIALLDLVFAPVTAAERQVGVRLSGQVVNPPDTSSLGISLYAGVLERWHLPSGATVAAGDKLVTIRSADVLAIQQAYLDSENDLRLAQQKFDRDRQLFEAGIVSRQRLLQSEGALRRIQLKSEALQQQLAQAGMQQQDLLAMAAGDYTLGTYSVRAPIAGSLGHRAYSTGQYVPANAAVAELTGSDRPWLSIQVPARLLPFVQLGSRLSVAGTGRTLTLRQRDFAIDPDSQSVEILAQFDAAADLVPGQLLSVELHPEPGALLIPATAVVHEGLSNLVYVRTAAGVEVRALDLMPLGDAYLATTGISSGEMILVRGTALVKGIQLGLGSDE